MKEGEKRPLSNIDLPDGHVARPIGAVGDRKELEDAQDVMATVMKQMLEAGGAAQPLIVQYNNKEAIISPANGKKTK